MPGSTRHASANILLKPLDSALEQCVPYHCLLDQLGVPDRQVVHVTLTDDTNGQILTRVARSVAGAVPLGHSPRCSCKLHASSAQSIQAPVARRPMRVGVVVLVESTERGMQNSKILLTRRKDTATLFPSQWVLPGGHVDEGEDLITAAMREVREETGICIATTAMDLPDGVFNAEESVNPKVDLFCLWESNYPASPEDGPPTSHHLVPFYRVKVPWSSEEIPLHLQEAEVSGAAWVDSALVKTWIQAHSGMKVPCPFSEDGKWPLDDCPVHSEGYFNGVLLQGDKGHRAPEPYQFDMQKEAIALGHQFCLLNWAVHVPTALDNE